MLWRIVIGLGIMAFGIFMTIKNLAFVRIVGPMEWTEKFFPGSQSMGYKLLGIIIFFIGLFISTNFMEKIIVDVFGQFFGL